MSVRKIVNYLKNKKMLRYIAATLFIIIGAIGIIFPVLEGFSTMTVGILLFNINNKKLSKKIFKHEKALNIMFYSSLILFIIPTLLFATGILSFHAITEKYGEFSSKVTQLGKNSLEKFSDKILYIFGSSSEEIQRFCIVCGE